MPNTSLCILLGLGREGFSSYSYLRQNNPSAQFLAFDDKDVLKTSEKWQNVAKNDKKIAFFNKKNDFVHALEQKKSQTTDQQSYTILKTPGIPPSHPVVNALMSPAWRSAVRWTTNTSLFFEAINTALGQHTDKRRVVSIGVTGTKGKSTTTALIHHVLRTAGLPALLGGNIGKPPLDLLDEFFKLLAAAEAVEPIFVVLELSSHQLADLSVSPNIAVIQEIVPEHLDYYPNFETYVDAKSHIARYQHSDDLLVYNSDYALVANVAALSPARHRAFTMAGCAAEIGRIVPLNKLPLKGTHNLLNIMPSVLIAEELHLEMKTVREALLSFTPLPHRMELVATQNGISYYNDSLSTTPEAAVAALHSFEPGTVVLLAGGYDRHLDYTPLGQAVVEQLAKAVILFPTTGERIKQAVLAAAQRADSPPPTLIDVADMAEAVQKARSIALSGDTILLSPASASFNMYRDYQERGEAFKMEVKTHDGTRDFSNTFRPS